MGTGGSGSYPWTESKALNHSALDHRIKISSTSVAGCSDTSDNNFAIVQAPAGLPDLTPYKPSAWSGKIVVAKTTDTFTEDSPLYATDNLSVAAAVINNGAKLVGQFRVKFFVDDQKRAAGSRATELDENYYWYFYNLR